MRSLAHSVITCSVFLGIATGVISLCTTNRSFADDEAPIVVNPDDSSGQLTPRFRLIGEVKAGQTHPYAINGEDFSVSTDTEIQGEFHIGVFAEVSGPFVAAQPKVADRVIIAEVDTGSSTSGDSAAAAELR